MNVNKSDADSGKICLLSEAEKEVTGPEGATDTPSTVTEGNITLKCNKGNSVNVV
jgi:hypothetical protein